MELNKRQKEFVEAYGNYSAKSPEEFIKQRKLLGFASLPEELKTLELMNALLCKCSKKTVSLNDFLEIEKEIQENENLVGLKKVMKEEVHDKAGEGFSIQRIISNLYIASEKLMIINEREKMKAELGDKLLPLEGERKVLKNKW